MQQEFSEKQMWHSWQGYYTGFLPDLTWWPQLNSKYHYIQEYLVSEASIWFRSRKVCFQGDATYQEQSVSASPSRCRCSVQRRQPDSVSVQSLPCSLFLDHDHIPAVATPVPLRFGGSRRPWPISLPSLVLATTLDWFTDNSI